MLSTIRILLSRQLSSSEEIRTETIEFTDRKKLNGNGQLFLLFEEKIIIGMNLTAVIHLSETSKQTRDNS